MDKLCKIANKTMPKSNVNPEKPKNPWFSDDCSQTSLTFKIFPVDANFKKYYIKRAKAT